MSSSVPWASTETSRRAKVQTHITQIHQDLSLLQFFLLLSIHASFILCVSSFVSLFVSCLFFFFYFCLHLSFSLLFIISLIINLFFVYFFNNFSTHIFLFLSLFLVLYLFCCLSFFPSLLLSFPSLPFFCLLNLFLPVGYFFVCLITHLVGKLISFCIYCVYAWSFFLSLYNTVNKMLTELHEQMVAPLQRI